MSYRIRYNDANRTKGGQCLVDSFETRAEAEAAMSQEREARSRGALSAARGGPGSFWWVEEVGLANNIGRYAAIATAAALLIAFIAWGRHHPLIYCALGFEGNCREPTWVKVVDTGTDSTSMEEVTHFEAEMNTETFKRVGNTVTFDERMAAKGSVSIHGTLTPYLLTIETNVSVDCANLVRATNAIASLKYQTAESDGRLNDNPGLTATALQMAKDGGAARRLSVLGPAEKWACSHVPG
jgi:hypothetical protein